MDHTPKKKKAGIPDETFVWFTSMALAVGLAMVIALLTVIFTNGCQAFWPRRIAEVHLVDGSVLGGEVNKIQKKITGGGSEWQLYVANKDAYGFSFKYVDAKDIARMDYPRDLLSIERMEYGDAIGFPVRLELKGGESFAFSESLFEERLAGLVKEAAERRAAIKDVEKRQIGSINFQMEKLRLRERSLEREKHSEDRKRPERDRVQRARAELEARYQILAKKAGDLRARQNENSLVYRLPTGEERGLAIGQIVHTYFPNRLSLAERSWLAVRNFWVFLIDDPREANTEGGIFPAIFGTFVMTLLMSMAVMPFGVLAAIYLREYAKEGLFVRSVRIAVNNLAGVPSIVFGVFGLGFFVYFIGGSIDALFFKDSLPTPTFGTGGIFWVSLTLALMTVPVVIVATEEALAAVARGVREGSLACGASKWQTIRHVVLPASAPGIMTGLILAMARGAGEVAPLMLVGVVKLAPALPLDGVFPFIHLDRKFMHLGFHIYDLGFQSPDSEAAKPMVFATTFLLILLVVLLNLTAIVLRERLRKKYAVGAF
jgi:phosphate transport system permease protein